MRIVSYIANSYLLLVLIVVANIQSSLWAQDQSKEMVAKLAEICRKHDVPAMTAAVVNAKGLVKADCFGVRKRGTSDKVDLSDRFPIGSNTKSMTATLAAVLVEAGKIEWETTIGDVWPKATDKDLHPKLRKVSLDQLLSHQGGIPGNISDLSNEAWAKHFEEKQSPTLERKAMLKLALSKAPSQPQGTFLYSNLGYAIDHLHRPQVDFDKSGAKYACGWICLDTEFGPALNHAGSNTNSYAVIWILPEANFAAVVCANSGQQKAHTACEEMMRYLKAEHAAKNGANAPNADPGKVTLERLVGRYQLNPNFIFDVKHKDGHLMVGITNQPTQEVFADSPTKWSYRGVNAQLEFHLRADGPAYALTLHQNGAAQKAKRISE